MQQRLSGIPARAPDVQITLYEQEVPALDKALSGFVAFVLQKVSPSREREETLHDLERFRRGLMEAIG